MKEKTRKKIEQLDPDVHQAEIRKLFLAEEETLLKIRKMQLSPSDQEGSDESPTSTGDSLDEIRKEFSDASDYISPPDEHVWDREQMWKTDRKEFGEKKEPHSGEATQDDLEAYGMVHPTEEEEEEDSV